MIDDTDDRDKIICDLREQLVSAARWIKYEWSKQSEFYPDSASFWIGDTRYTMDMGKIRDALKASEKWRRDK